MDLSSIMGRKNRRSGYDKARDYARCMTRPWTWQNLSQDLGLPRRSTIRYMGQLREAGEIVGVGPAKKGLYLHFDLLGPRQRKRILQQRAEAEAAKRQEERQQRVLSVMKPGIRYTSRNLRQMAEMPDLKFSELKVMESEGLIELLQPRPRTYWWTRRKE